MSYAKIRPRRSTKGEWEITNPILLEGELGIETPDNGSGLVKIKFGDGVTAWNDLEYAIDASSAPSIYGGTVLSSRDIYLRSGIQSQWELIDPVLGLGEIVFDISNDSVKIGDGIRKFSELPYVGANIDMSDIDFDFGDEDAT